MTRVQELLNQDARMSNEGIAKDNDLRIIVQEEIRGLRGHIPPPCWGEDDCSTDSLVRCPWRIDCGE